MQKSYNRSEVLQHNTLDDCWVIINNKVYDLSDFIKKHPGGKEIIETRAGEDATSFFYLKHVSNKGILRQLETYCIGEICASEKIDLEALKEPFLNELLESVMKQNLYTVSKKELRSFNLIRFFNLLVFFVCYALVFYTQLAIIYKSLLIILQAMVGASLFGFLAHEATHRNYPKTRLSKIVLSIYWPLCWPFISEKALRYEHNSHHIKIGDTAYDFEVAGFSKFIRYSNNITPNFLHRYQHKLAMFFYPFYANIITTYGGISSDFWNIHNRKVAWLHNLSILFSLFYFILLPAFFTTISWYFLVIFYLCYQSILFSLVYVSAAINHFIPETVKPLPEAYKNYPGYYVCHNTSNFCADSNYWFWQSGGFNIQIEHHLLPFIPVENLHKLKKIVKELCHKYQYPYYEFDSFGQMWKEHYSFLKMLSKYDETLWQTDEMNKRNYEAK